MPLCSVTPLALHPQSTGHTVTSCAPQGPQPMWAFVLERWPLTQSLPYPSGTFPLGSPREWGLPPNGELCQRPWPAGKGSPVSWLAGSESSRLQREEGTAPTVPQPLSIGALCPGSRSGPQHPSKDSWRADPSPTPFPRTTPPHLSTQRPTPVTEDAQALWSLHGRCGPGVQGCKDEAAPRLASPGLEDRPLALLLVRCRPLPRSP